MKDKDYLQSLGIIVDPNEIEKARRAFLGRIVDPNEIEKARKALNPFSNSDLERAKQTLATLQEQVKRQWESALEMMGPLLEKWRATLEQAAKIMGDNGWWLVLDLPLDFYQQLVESRDSINHEELTSYIVRRANHKRCERLTEIVDAWKVDAFESRKEHFAQALWAHKRQKYCVTVPTLLVHVEGIIRESVDDPTGWRLQKQLKKFKNKFPQSESLEMGLTAVMNFYNIGVLTSLYEIHQPGIDAPPSGLNRNAVLHGLWTGYATKEYSTKIFLLLDMLHSMLRRD